MKVNQIYTNCLAQGAYYIESNGEAAIIDPLREVQQYIDMAAERNATIKYVFETHFHADFVSGHIDLAKATGAKIIYGPTTMETGFEMYAGKDDEIFPLGDVSIKLLHTPGHTTESSCFLLRDEEGKDTALFTGDTLFIGDVGRPDLAQKVIAELTQTKLAKMLYNSLRTKIMPLNDEIIVYPGHGAGSACGKNMSKETSDTLGNQKQHNYALRTDMSEEEFIKEVLTGLTQPPAYFPQNVMMNIQGYDSVNKVIEDGMKAFDAEVFNKLREDEDIVIVDTRNELDFAKGHVPGSIFIGVDGNFATWAGTVLKDVKQKLIFIADKGREEEVVTRFARVGFDDVLGHLKDGFETWVNAGLPVKKIETIAADDFTNLNIDSLDVIDVRRESEFNSQHMKGARNIPLDYLNTDEISWSTNKDTYVHCAGGYRSIIFISILLANGIEGAINIEGGFGALEKTSKLPLTEYVCPTTLL